MVNDTIKWQKNQAFKIYTFIQKRLDFDNLKIKLPEEHQLAQLPNITVKKIMNYCVNKLNNQHVTMGHGTDQMTPQGYLDETDTIALMDSIALITKTTDGEIKRNLNQFYRLLQEVIKYYELQVKDQQKFKDDLEQLTKDYENQEKLVVEANKLTEEFNRKWEKGKKRWDEFKEDFEKLMDFETKKEDEKQVK